MAFKKVLSFSNNKNGFSLVEIMAALGITTILALALASTMGFLGTHKKSVELSQEADELVSDFRRALQNPTTCDSMLNGKTIDPTGVPTAVTLAVVNQGTSKTFAAGTTLVPGISLSSVDLKVDPIMPYKDTAIDVSGTMTTMRQYHAMIHLQFQKTATFNPKPYFIPMKLYTQQGTNTVIQCVAQQMKDANDCVAIGYKWDDATSTCMPTGRCLYGGSFSNSPVGGFVNPLTNANACPAGYSEQQTGAINYSSDCGKSCVQANVVPVMSCLRCVNATGADIALAASTAATVSNSIDFAADIDSDSQSVVDQFNQIMANLALAAAQPGFVCSASGTYLSGSAPNCTGGTLSTQSIANCCSGNADVCTDTYDASSIGEGTVTTMRYMQCQ